MFIIKENLKKKGEFQWYIWTGTSVLDTKGWWHTTFRLGSISFKEGGESFVNKKN